MWGELVKELGVGANISTVKKSKWPVIGSSNFILSWKVIGIRSFFKMETFIKEDRQ